MEKWWIRLNLARMYPVRPKLSDFLGLHRLQARWSLGKIVWRFRTDPSAYSNGTLVELCEGLTDLLNEASIRGEALAYRAFFNSCLDRAEQARRDANESLRRLGPDGIPPGLVFPIGELLSPHSRIQLYRRRKLELSEVDFVCFLSRANIQLGKWEEAIRVCDVGLAELYPDAGSDLGRMAILKTLAIAHVGAGHLDKAKGAIGASLEVARALHNPGEAAILEMYMKSVESGTARVPDSFRNREPAWGSRGPGGSRGSRG